MDALMELLYLMDGAGGAMDGAIKAIAGVALLFALASCFFGYKLYKVWIAITGFLAFGVIGLIIGVSTGGDVGIAIFIALIFAVIGAFIAFKLYKAGVFILCATLGFIFGMLLTNSVAVGVIIALVLGVAGVMFIKPIIIISTGASGGLTAGSSLAIMLGLGNAAGIFLGIILAGLGIYVQYYTDKKNAALTADTGADGAGAEAPTAAQDGQSLSSTFAFIKSSLDTTAKNVSQSIKVRIETESEDVLKKAKGLTFDEICENTEEILYSNKVLKNVVPFADYVLYGFTAIALLEMFTGSYLSYMVIPAIFCIVCIVKKKYIPAMVFMPVAVLRDFMRLLRYSKALTAFTMFNTLFLILEIAIFSYVAYLLVKKYMATAEGGKLKSKLEQQADAMKTATTAIGANVLKPRTVVKIKCGKCGSLNDESAKFCANCGNSIFVEQAADETAAGETATDEAATDEAATDETAAR